MSIFVVKIFFKDNRSLTISEIFKAFNQYILGASIDQSEQIAHSELNPEWLGLELLLRMIGFCSAQHLKVGQ